MFDKINKFALIWRSEADTSSTFSGKSADQMQTCSDDCKNDVFALAKDGHYSLALFQNQARVFG